MDHITRINSKFTTDSTGIGDLTVNASYTATQNKSFQLYTTFGFSLPTGSISQKDNSPKGRSILPYPMQLGSGTVDPKLGINAI